MEEKNFNPEDIIEIPEGREEEFLPRVVCDALKKFMENDELITEMENGDKIFLINMDKEGNIISSELVDIDEEKIDE